MSGHEELIDLVDETDSVIGSIAITALHEQKLHNFRGIHAFIKNADGQLWIARRAAHKRIAPLALDASISGHVSSGETYEEGLIRESMEECNLDLTTLPFKETAYLTPAQQGVYCFEKIYEIALNKAPAFNRAEIVEGLWLYPDEVRSRMQKGEPFKGDLMKIFAILYPSEQVMDDCGLKRTQ